MPRFSFAPVVRGLWIACLFLSALQTSAQAAPIIWADWTSASGTGPAGSANGVFAGTGIAISYSGEINPSAQTGGGTYFWAPNVYTSAGVDNPPPDSDVIRLTGGIGVTQTITFSQPVTNPVMAILSLGQSGLPTSYVFDAPFDVLSDGPGFFGPPGTLTEMPGNVLLGVEGHGTIQFIGTFNSISWTVPTREFWHGFTVGLVVPEPGSLMVFGFASIGLAGYWRRLRMRNRKASA